MPIGGAEDRIAKRSVLGHFVKLAGGAQANIVVIPSASMFSHELGPEYTRIFKELGAGTVNFVNIQARDEANDPAWVERFSAATGIFMSGGDQVKLVVLLGGTLVLEMMRTRYERHGAVIAGTSAGASALSDTMIAFGRSGQSPSLRMVQMAPGLGFAAKLIIDQHFRERDRIGRLVSAVSYNPGVLGIGVDEDTAFVIGPDDNCTVVGSGSVVVVDGSQISYTDLHEVKRYEAIAAFNLRVHFITPGYQFNLRTRLPTSIRKRSKPQP